MAHLDCESTAPVNIDDNDNQDNKELPQEKDHIHQLTKTANEQLSRVKDELQDRIDEQQSPNSHSDSIQRSDRLAIDDSPASGEFMDENDLNLTSSGTPPHAPDQPSACIWTLPDDKEMCTLEEIRRGQVINKVASNECPVPGCGKKINELKADPSPGTIASGLRTHVVFVHYANIYRKPCKKRKLTWQSGKRRGNPSPKKSIPANQQLAPPIPSPANSDIEFNTEPENYSMSNFLPAGLNLIQKTTSPRRQSSSLLTKRPKQNSGLISVQPTSLQSLMQATGGSLTIREVSNLEDRQNTNQKKQVEDVNSPQKNYNQHTSSLFSILAGLTQQQDQPLNTARFPTTSRAISKMTTASSNPLNITQYSNKNNQMGISETPVASSLLNLLNEKMSNTNCGLMQAHSRRAGQDSNISRNQNSMSHRQNDRPPSVQTPQNNLQANISEPFNYNQGNNCNTLNNHMIDTQVLSNDNSLPLNSFIELIAIKTGCNIGPAGIAETRKIIEKFATSMILSSQTIADHYVAPFSTETIQQKPEIGPSDVMLAYKMMQKTFTQP